MMAAVQPFVSGAISKTINMPNNATVKECGESYLQSWRLGLKANRSTATVQLPATWQPGAADRRTRTRRPRNCRPPARTTVITERVVEKIVERVRRP